MQEPSQPVNEPDEQINTRSREEIKEEYLDASTNVRHWSNLRFAQLTVYIAVSGGLTAILFNSAFILAEPFRLIIASAGVITTIVFWITEERTMAYWRNFIERAAALEPALGYRQYSTRPPGKLISSANAIRVLFVLLFIFWVSLAIWT